MDDLTKLLSTVKHARFVKLLDLHDYPNIRLVDYFCVRTTHSRDTTCKKTIGRWIKYPNEISSSSFFQFLNKDEFMRKIRRNCIYLVHNEPIMKFSKTRPKLSLHRPRAAKLQLSRPSGTNQV